MVTIYTVSIMFSTPPPLVATDPPSRRSGRRKKYVIGAAVRLTNRNYPQGSAGKIFQVYDDGDLDVQIDGQSKIERIKNYKRSKEVSFVAAEAVSSEPEEVSETEENVSAEQYLEFALSILNMDIEELKYKYKNKASLPKKLHETQGVSSSSSEHEIILGSLNTRGLDETWLTETRVYTISQLLKRYAIDVLALQEIVGAAKGEDRLTSDGLLVLNAFVSMLNAQFSPNIEWAIISAGVRRGYAKSRSISERLGFIYNTKKLNVMESTIFRHENSGRDSYQGTFQLVGTSRVISILNVHAVSNSNKPEWYQDLFSRLKVLSDESGRVPDVIAGDFNHDPSNVKREYQVLRERRAWGGGEWAFYAIDVDGESTLTYLKDGEGASAYDHIFLRTGCEFDVQKSAVIATIEDQKLRRPGSNFLSEEDLTDHLMISARLRAK
jgi:hypothetical protein